MKKKLIGNFTCLLFSLFSIAQLPVVSGGSVRRFDNFPSGYVEPRNVDVWLPGDYDSTKKYAVLYMQDGQMLFDSSITWNKQEWKVDETMTGLLNEKKIMDCIVVAVWNNGRYRHAEYFPQDLFNMLPADCKDSLVKKEFFGNPQADNYLRFLVAELKPFIDSKFSVYKDPSHTFIAGSSMGGLISLYAICEYPGVFGGAACISTHWAGALVVNDKRIPRAFNQYLLKNLPSPAAHKIYFDHGTVALDSWYPPYQVIVDQTMRKKGFTAANWVTKVFKGEDHSEKAWSKRLSIPLLFLLSPGSADKKATPGK